MASNVEEPCHREGDVHGIGQRRFGATQVHRRPEEVDDALRDQQASRDAKSAASSRRLEDAQTEGGREQCVADA